ncbi:MAG: hypothetical protein U5R49_13545 [Deltaproteobacteria bacterium]|nr:hypothetical protein [Deltaproteobacteria bacterium]
MKAILQVRFKTETQNQKTVAEKAELENQIARLEKERQTIEDLADARVQEYQASLSQSQARMKQEAEKRKRLEEELKRVRLEKEEAAHQQAKVATLQEQMRQEARRERPWKRN